MRKVILGCAVAAPLSGLLLLTLTALWANPAGNAMITKWQDLLSGLLSFITATIGFTFLYQQIAATRGQIAANDRLEQERIARRFRAARAKLPHHLNALMEHTQVCGLELARVYSEMQAERTVTPAFPTLDPTIIPALSELIELGDEEISELLAELASKLQIQAARLSGAASGAASGRLMILPLNIETYAFDNAEIDALASSLFPFARRETNTLPELPSDEAIAESQRRTLPAWHALRERRSGVAGFAS